MPGYTPGMMIGIDARLTQYRKGGISTYILRLIDALARIAPETPLRIFQSRKQREALTYAFPRSLLWTPCHHRWERIALSAELIPYRLAIYHTTDFIPPLHGAKRHITTIHDLNFLHYPGFLTDESRRYYNDQIAYAVDHADHILTISDHSKRDLVAMLGVAPEKITVHPMGVDPDFRPLEATVIADFCQRWQLPSPYFLFVGTFEPRKNIVGLAQAYRHLLDAVPDAPPLVLAGRRGWNFAESERAITALDLGERLIWRHDIPQEEMPALYNGALAVILPSFYEGFGMPPLEGMACGKTPIVSDRSSLPEVVGAVGLQVDPDDPLTIAEAMRRVFEDTAWRAGQEAAAIERARAFTWDAAGRIALATYQQVSRS